MYIAIPVDNQNLQKAKIAKILEAKGWAVIDFDEGVVKSMQFSDSYHPEGVDWIDFIVVENRYENIIDFLNEGIMVLARREGQDAIEDIIEAFKFKELDEAGF